MKHILKGNKGFSLTETIIVVALFTVILATVISVWLFTHRSWSVEENRTMLRLDLMKALETVHNDIRLSSATYMSFYPAAAGDYTAVSMPLADTDANGFLTLDANGDVQWDKTVIYHIYTAPGGEKTLRRTVFDPRDNTLDHDQRYAQLQSVISTGTGGAGSVTDTAFLENLDEFKISPLPTVVDFYEDSSSPVRVGKVVFGWIRVGDGDHDIRFEVTGKHDSSSGYALGIDYLRVEPCGSKREAEYYNSSFAHSGALDSSGQTITRVYDNIWNNDNFLEYDATAAGDYIEFSDYYDLWRESAFDSSILNNAVFTGEEVYVKLELPEDRETGKENITWYAYAEAGDSTQDGQDGDMPAYPITMRTIISNDIIDQEGDLVRVKFKSSSENPLRIDGAYITRRDSNENGLVNLSTSGRTVEEFHRHQQLFFRDVNDGDNDGDTDEILATGWMAPDSELWSEWTAFPLVKEVGGADMEYFVTVCIPDLDTAGFPSGWSGFSSSFTDSKYWIGSSTHSYYITGDYATVLLPASGTPDWSGYTVIASDNIYVTAEIDVWDTVGTVESHIQDTGLDNPGYNEVKWSEISPSGTEVLMKVRSSDSQFMDGATDWSAIGGSVNNPCSLSIGTGRFVQFLAELSTDVFWMAPSSILAYAQYVDAQLALSNDYDFPTAGGEYLVTSVYSTWVDDVAIDWPGDDRMCVLSGYVARKNDYGQVKITVDGRDLIKVLDVKMGVAVDYQDQTISEENNVEVEPRNTGR